MRRSRFGALALGLFLLASRASDLHAQAADRWLLIPVITGSNGRSFDPSAWTGELESELRGSAQSVRASAVR